MRQLAPVAALVVAAGCATTTSVSTSAHRQGVSATVSSLARADAKRKARFIMLPGNDGVVPGDLLFQEFAAYATPLLVSQGLVKAESIEEADWAVFLAYGIGEPREHLYTYSLPIYGKVGVSSSHTTGSVSPSGTYTGTTTYTPSYGVVGSSTHTRPYTTYTRHVVLEALDLVAWKRGQAREQVWKTIVVSAGQSGDLRLVMPYLLSASGQFLMIDSGQEVRVTVYDDDLHVRWFKRLSRYRAQGRVEEAEPATSGPPAASP